MDSWAVSLCKSFPTNSRSAKRFPSLWQLFDGVRSGTDGDIELAAAPRVFPWGPFFICLHGGGVVRPGSHTEGGYGKLRCESLKSNELRIYATSNALLRLAIHPAVATMQRGSEIAGIPLAACCQREQVVGNHSCAQLCARNDFPLARHATAAEG
jgi:hypothetical protein